MPEETLVEQFTRIVQAENEKRKKEKTNSLFEADEYYHDMVKRGLIKPRGYTLKGIEDVHLPIKPIRRTM